MKQKVSFIIQNIKQNPAVYIVLFLQITISFILLGFSTMQYSEIKDYTKAMSGVLNTDNLYFIDNNTDFNRLAALEEDIKYREKWEELYNLIYASEKYDAYPLAEDTLLLEESESPEIYHSDVGEIKFDKERDVEYKRIHTISANENLIKSFDIRCKTGRMLNSSDMNENSRNIVLGANFSDDFKVGDKITLLDEEYNVVGILEENKFYLNPTRTSSVLYLNDYIIFPYYPDIYEYDNSSYSNIVTMTSFYADSEETAQEISAKSKELGLLDMEIKSCSEKYQEVRETIQDKIAILSTVAAIILIFAIICIVSALILIVQRQMNEFVIHYMCGATLSNIIVRICVPVVAIVFLAFIITAIIYRNIMTSATIFVFGIAVSLIITCIPAIKLKRLSISAMLRRRD